MFVEAYIFCVFLISSFLQTVTGFGYAIITAPLLALVLEAKETVMLVIITALIICLLLIRATRNQGSYRAVLPLLAASVVGAIPGAYVMTIISNDGLKLFIGILLLTVTTALWKNYTFRIPQNTRIESMIGFVSGFLTTTTGITGPPVILYYLNSKAEQNKTEFRANLTRFFVPINIASIFFSYIAGSLHIEDLWLRTLISIPALYMGFSIGEKMFHRISVSALRKGALLIVLVSSTAIIWSVLSKMYRLLSY